MDAKIKSIVEKVCKLYQNYGIKSITMDDVARELGYSKKTLYQLFRDKNELVSAVVDHQFNEKIANLDQAMENQENAIEAIFGFYKVQISLLREHKPSFVFDLKKYYKNVAESLHQKRQDKILSAMKANLKRGKEEGLYRQDIDEDLITRIHFVRIESILSSGLFPLEEILSMTFFTEVFKYHLYGVMSDKGRAYLGKNMDRLFETNE